MAAVFGFFSGILSDTKQLRQTAYIRTGCTRIDAQYFRVKLLSPRCDTLYGRVSADIEGAECGIERAVFPGYKDLWEQWGVPELPEKFITGHVKQAEIDLCDCLPEYESCGDDWEAEALDIKPPVSSVGFIVRIHLIIDALRPGATIKGVVALSDDVSSTKRSRHARDVDASPTEDNADLVDMTVARDGAAGVDKS
jgi:hypothetical protein